MSREIRSPFIPILLAYAARHGVDVPALLRAHGVSSRAASVVVSLRGPALRALCDDVASRLGDPDLGLNVALAAPRGAYGVAEYALRSAPTLREAFGRMARYQRLVNDLVELRIQTQSGSSTIVQRFPGEPLGGGRHGNTYALAVMVLLGRDVTGVEWPVRRAWLAHPETGDLGALARFLGVETIEHGAGQNAIEIASDVLELPVRTADSSLLAVMDRVAKLIGPVDGHDTIAAKAASHVRTLLPARAPSLDDVAERLGTSGRSLQRALAEAGTSFSRVLDDVRKQIVLSLLAETSLPLDEIAARAGYSDIRALKRSFRRWTGATPARWQREGAGEP